MVNTKNDEDINDNHKEISKDVDHIIEDDSDIAQTAMGDVGIWQIWLCVYLSLIKFPTVWAQFGIVFLAPQTDFHCVDKGREQKDQCVTNAGEKCTNWTYNHKIFTETITSEWDLVCEKNEYVNAGQAITLIGFIIGNVVCSMIADRIGRKKPLIISGIVQFAVGIIAAFSTSYTMFTFLRFIQAVAVGGSITVGFVLMMEVLGGKWRSIMITLTSIPFTVAHFAMVFIAYMTRHWRLFQLGTSLPCAFFLLYIWVIPESPRWLLAVGRDDEAMKILDAAAIKNKNPSPQSFAMTPRNTKIKQDREYTPGIADFYNSNTLLINTLYLCFNWFATGVSFFGLEQFVSLLDGDIFVHIAITASGLIPGMFLSVWLSERLGRQPTLIIGQLLCGCSCLTLVFILNDGGQVSGLCVAMITLGVLGSGILFPTIYLYSGEYYPILIRNLGVGICCGFSRLGFMVAPFINDLKRFHNNIPPLLMGLICIIASIMSYFLPETKECDSPDIILFQQAQRLRKVSVTPGIITVNRGDIAAELEGKYKSLSR